ncbi:MAG: lipid IV(A) 3-deoxy-D-manno-octulosonic acid transferase [Acidiferrobacterales bacterium]|nr:lipid IV(A) 3-deoxy-D-manno-octulosonic acid transferase [Acidiferrobacterales bacterium]
MWLFLYQVLLYLVSPVFLLRFLWRTWRNNDYGKRIGERVGLTGLSADKKRIWIHAVSVGEVNAAVPLVLAIQKKWAEKPIIVTTMTTTGADRVVQMFGESVIHRYLPYDFPGSMRRFLLSVNPEIGVIMETELWPNLIHRCDQDGIPLIYANVRLSERSFRGYQRVRGLFQPLLKSINRFAAQSEADAKRLVALGAPEQSVEVTGSLKFDLQMPASIVEAGHSIRRQLGQQRQVIVAASTHDEEELAMLKLFHRLKSRVPNLLLILVPRHPERFDSVYRLCQKSDVNVMKRSEYQGMLHAETDVLLVDQMGALTQFISAGDITFMGGSLVPVGGHNLLEPAALGRVVVFGPHMFNFAEISRLFVELGAGIQVQDAKELDEVMIELFEDTARRNQYAQIGEKLVKDNRGALLKVIGMVRDEIRSATQVG